MRFGVDVRKPELSVSKLSQQQALDIEVLGTEKFDRLVRDLGVMCSANEYRVNFAEGAGSAIETALRQKFVGAMNDGSGEATAGKVRVSVDELKIKFRCPLTSSLSMVCKSNARVRLSAQIDRAGFNTVTLASSKTVKSTSGSGGHCSLGSTPLSESISKSFEEALEDLMNQLDRTAG